MLTSNLRYFCDKWFEIYAFQLYIKYQKADFSQYTICIGVDLPVPIAVLQNKLYITSYFCWGYNLLSFFRIGMKNFCLGINASDANCVRSVLKSYPTGSPFELPPTFHRHLLLIPRRKNFSHRYILGWLTILTCRLGDCIFELSFCSAERSQELPYG